MDGYLSADFLFNLEKQWRIVRESNYLKMLSELWHPKLLRTRPLEGKSERLLWLIETASIEQLSANDGGEAGGSLNFDELSTVTTEFFPAYHARGYKIGKMKFLNALQGGLDPVESWMRQQGIYAAYYPQRLCAMTILNGANIVGYDGVDFWSTAHPVHPNISGLGTYANTFTGASSGSGSTFYPGALPIDDSVSFDVALINLGKALAYIRGHVVQPNGSGDPRNLVPKFIMAPPRMQSRVETLCNANMLSFAASGGAGPADIKDFLKKYRMLEPVICPEFDGARSYTISNGPGSATSTVTGSDTTYYIVCEEAGEQEIGSLVQNLRLPFKMQFYTGEGMSGVDGVDAILGRSNDLEYHHEGWTAVNVGHPFGIFMCAGS